MEEVPTLGKRSLAKEAGDEVHAPLNSKIGWTTATGSKLEQVALQTPEQHAANIEVEQLVDQD